MKQRIKLSFVKHGKTTRVEIVGNEKSISRLIRSIQEDPEITLYTIMPAITISDPGDEVESIQPKTLIQNLNGSKN